MPDDFATTLSPRVTRLRRSPTAVISERLRALRAEGRMVDNLGEGELDFETPPHICKAAHDAIDAGDTKYTAVGGTSLAVGYHGQYKWETGWGTNLWSLSVNGKQWVDPEFHGGGGGGYSVLFGQPSYQSGEVPSVKK